MIDHPTPGESSPTILVKFGMYSPSHELEQSVQSLLRTIPLSHPLAICQQHWGSMFQNYLQYVFSNRVSSLSNWTAINLNNWHNSFCCPLCNFLKLIIWACYILSFITFGNRLAYIPTMVFPLPPLRVGTVAGMCLDMKTKICLPPLLVGENYSQTIPLRLLLGTIPLK